MLFPLEQGLAYSAVTDQTRTPCFTRYPERQVRCGLTTDPGQNRDWNYKTKDHHWWHRRAPGNVASF